MSAELVEVLKFTKNGFSALGAVSRLIGKHIGWSSMGGQHNADGQGEVSGGLAADRAGSEGESRMDLPGLRDAVPETRGTV